MAATFLLNTHEIQGLCQRYFGDNQRRRQHDKIDNFRVLCYKLKPTSDAPTGFLGHHQFLNIGMIVVDADGTENPLTLRFFTKSAPSDIASRMQYLEEFGVFKKEIKVYRDLLPNLQNIFADVAPKCYYADNNNLVFENLVEEGYRMAAGRDGLLNYEHLKCTLKTLAALHAGSIVYEVQQGKKINEMFPDAVVENAYPKELTEQHVRWQNFNNGCKVATEFIKCMPKYRENLEYILLEYPKKMAIIFDLIQTSIKYQNVFLHGDLWANNVMFQYGKFDETPVQCRLVDFQLGRYAPPMLDIITMLTIPTSRKFRDQYLSELLCNYYRFITEFLRREGLSIEDFIPKQQYYASAEEFRIIGLIESILFSHMTILPAELTQTLTGSADGFSDFFERKRVEICMKAFNEDQVYRERLTDMIEDFVDNFVLK